MERDGRVAVRTPARAGDFRGEFLGRPHRVVGQGHAGRRGIWAARSVVVWGMLAGASQLGLAAAPAAGEGPSPLEAKYLGAPRQVTQGFVRAGEGYFSPDGATIVYQAVPADYPFYQIFTQPLAGGAPRRVSTGRGRTTCSYFSPDGQRLLFASSHLDPALGATEEAERRQQAADRAAGRRRRYEWSFDPATEIFAVPVAGGELTRLTNSPGYDAEGAYTPDGRQIVFCSDRDGDPDLYVMDADGANVRQLTNAPGYDGGPFTSPDGQWVCFRSDRAREGYLQIFVIRLDGTSETQLTQGQVVNWAPYWHPSEPWLIWTGADHSNPMARPNYDLWLMHFDREADRILPGPITRITDHPTADVLPVFAPDGRHLMWTSNRGADGSSQLWYAEFHGPAPESSP